MKLFKCQANRIIFPSEVTQTENDKSTGSISCVEDYFDSFFY